METAAELELGDWQQSGSKERVVVNLASGVAVASNRIGVRQKSAVGQQFRLSRPTPSPDAKQSSRLKVKTLRRVRGFLIETIGPECKVAFEDKGNLVYYYLPSNSLSKAGITAPNQPFEMDEIEIRLSSSDYFAGYRFKPLANVTDAVPETVPLDDEYKCKLQTILHHFKSA